MTDAELDARFAALGPIEPPAHVVDATLASYHGLRAAERHVTERRVVPLRRRALPWIGAALAIAAGLLLTLRAPTEHHGDPSDFVPRGSAERALAMDVSVVVGTSRGFERLDPARVWTAGDTVRFRVHVDAPTEVVLSREGVELWRGDLAAGDTEIPVSWALEPGEGPSTFRVEAGDVVEVIELAGVTR